MMGFSALTSSMISRYGSDVVVKRTGNPDVTIRAYIRGASDDTLAGETSQTPRDMICSASDLSAAGFSVPPRKGDKVVSNGKTYSVEYVEPGLVDDVVVRYNLRLKG